MAEPNVEQHRPIAEISHQPGGFERFLDRNQKLLIMIGVVIAIAAAVGVVMTGVKEGADRSGGNALVAAEDIEALEQVVEEHTDSPAAASAALLLSDRQWEQGLQDDAIATLRAEIAARPEHPATHPARARLGARLAAQGKTDEAKAAFEELLAAPTASYLAPYALSQLAQIARDAGDTEAAEGYLEQAREQYPANPLTSIASQTGKFIGFEMPEEIDPPAAEPGASEAMPDSDPLATPPFNLEGTAMDSATSAAFEAFAPPAEPEPAPEPATENEAPAEPEPEPATEAPAADEAEAGSENNE